MKKIMFNDNYGLTQAVLDERKTHTRRVAMPEFLEGILGKSFSFTEEDKSELLRLSKYKIGEEIAIAQSYNTIIQEAFDKGGEFKGSCSIFKSKGLYNKMFVRAELMPHRIKITGLRVERLQDISEEDCLKEGVRRFSCREFGVDGIRVPYTKTIVGKYVMNIFPTAQSAFANLIDKTCGKGTWDSNPWVFVYEFELIK